jgi:transposase InsO family protein
MPGFIHSDRGSSFMSADVKNYLASRGVATSHSTPYHPIGNGQVERYNGIVWKGIRLALVSIKLPVQQWEKVLPDVVHSIRSLLSTATNTTPHERFFNFARKSSQGPSLPSWLHPGPVLLRKFVRSSKHDDLVEEVELTHANLSYAHIR